MAKSDFLEIFKRVSDSLRAYNDILEIRRDTDEILELFGKKRVKYQESEQFVDGIYFGAVIIQKSFVGFYFFPIYTNPEAFKNIPLKLKKCLKGKSCFHLKDMDEELFEQIDDILSQGIAFYKLAELV